MSGVEKGTVKRGREEGDTRLPHVVFLALLLGVCYSFPLLVVCPSGRRCITRNDVWCKSQRGFKSLHHRTNENPSRFVSAGFLHARIVLGWCWRVCWWVFVWGYFASFYRVCATSGALPVLADSGVGKIVLCVLRFLTTRWSLTRLVFCVIRTPRPRFSVSWLMSW